MLSPNVQDKPATAIYSETVEIENHLHNNEIWRGIRTPQTATAWADDVLTPFHAISGANAYGSDVNDEALVLGTVDTPVVLGMTKFDFHRVLFLELSEDSVFKVRIIWDAGTMANAIIAGQYTEMMVQNNPAGNKANGIPSDILMPRIDSGVDQVWAQAWNVTNNSTVDFVVGFHEYLV